MRSEQALWDRLEFLQKIAEMRYGSSALVNVEDPLLRGEMYALLWSLDLLG